jgi:transcription antitermination factor NusG
VATFVQDTTPMPNWYALYVKPKKEKTVETLLRQRHFEAFSPSILERRSWSDRIKTHERTLFPGYVFCRFEPHGEQRLPVLTVPNVHWIVGSGRDAETVPDAEVDALRRAVHSGAPVRPHEFIEVGDPVEVIAGPLAGVRGVLLGNIERQATVQLILSVELLRRSVSVEVPADGVRPIRDRRMERIAAELSRASFAGSLA